MLSVVILRVKEELEKVRTYWVSAGHVQRMNFNAWFQAA